jgi:hypothetical protein
VETCNGVDDDGDGHIDDLGTFTCGLGACERTVAACVGGTLQHCVPGAPAVNSDGCDGVDNDCDGAADEDCGACWHVAPDGDDAAAVASDGESAFVGVQAAIDYANAHRDLSTVVCVAAGPTCGATATFPGPAGADLTMRNGVDILANYESTTWTRCTNSTTHLVPQTGRGVVFGSDIQSTTNLDGFTIDRMDAPTVAGVTVDGGQGAELSNLTIQGGAGHPGQSYGVQLVNGGDGRVVRSKIDNGVGILSSAIQAVSARVDVLDNCSSFDASERCVACGINLNWVSSGGQPTQRMHGVDLVDSPGSRVERTGICSTFTANDGMGVFVTGDARDVVVRASLVSLVPRTNTYGVRLESCTDGTPHLVDSVVALQQANISLSGPLPGTAAVSAPGCKAVIESNPGISVNIFRAATAIECQSGCVITGNSDISLSRYLPPSSGLVGATTVAVQANCSRVDHNAILGFSQTCNSGSCSRDATALLVNGGWVSSNRIVGGSGGKIRGVGVDATSGGARIENNVIIGVGGLPLNVRYQFDTVIGVSSSDPSRGVGLQGYGDIHSNLIVGAQGPPAGNVACDSTGLLLTHAGGQFRDNVISGGACGVSVWRPAPGYIPEVFERNALYNGPVSSCPSSGFLQTACTGVILLDSPALPPEEWQLHTSAAAVNALSGFNASGTIDADCAPSADGHLALGSPCVDAGTSVGAPFVDEDGDLRDAEPDIGPDEVVAP